jgi:hypothetical protein
LSKGLERDHKLRGDAKRLENLLDSTEESLREGKKLSAKQDQGLWSDIKSITHDVWEGGKTFIKDLGLKPQDLLTVAGGLLALL